LCLDEELKLYHYIGRGRDGDQTLTGANRRLEKSSEKNINIHFFRQFHINSNHQYIGKVKHVRTIPNTQTDKHGQTSRIFEFLLRLIEDY